MENHSQAIQDIAVQLIDLMGVDSRVGVAEKEGVFTVQVNAENTGMLIGYHGETLSAFQLILGLLIHKQTGEWVKIAVNVGDYLEKRLKQLEQMADNAVGRAREDGVSVTLPYLNSRERRHIHLYLEGVDGIRTESVGEDEERRLVIFPTTSAKSAQ